jgi:excisionase family DNA binding protein
MTETLQMLTPRDIARILGVHQKTVHLWLRNGRLKGVKISYRAWRIPQSALDQFIEQNSNGIPQKRTEGPPSTGTDSTMPANDIPGPSAGNPDISKIKMKHYLRDIKYGTIRYRIIPPSFWFKPLSWRPGISFSDENQIKRS